ncbi:hypothetical protein N7470_004196 [Penicillium chermesinum]|nr:hypothetical protein N7470_004196 [Penicillium chermesinum]
MKLSLLLSTSLVAELTSAVPLVAPGDRLDTVKFLSPLNQPHEVSLGHHSKYDRRGPNEEFYHPLNHPVHGNPGGPQQPPTRKRAEATAAAEYTVAAQEPAALQ